MGERQGPRSWHAAQLPGTAASGAARSSPMHAPGSRPPPPPSPPAPCGARVACTRSTRCCSPRRTGPARCRVPAAGHAGRQAAHLREPTSRRAARSSLRGACLPQGRDRPRRTSMRRWNTPPGQSGTRSAGSEVAAAPLPLAARATRSGCTRPSTGRRAAVERCCRGCRAAILLTAAARVCHVFSVRMGGARALNSSAVRSGRL